MEARRVAGTPTGAGTNGRLGADGAGTDGAGTGDDVRMVMIPGDVPVVVCPRPRAPAAVLSVWFARGSRHESARRNGVTHLLEHVLVEAPCGDGGALPERLEESGCQVNATTARDFLCVYVHTPRASWRQAAGELVRQVLHARLTPEVLESQRRIVREELRREQADPGAVVHDLFYAALFDPDPLALPSGGTPATIDDLALGDVTAHLDALRVAGGVGVVAVGDVDVEEVAALVAGAGLGDLPRGEPPTGETHLPERWTRLRPGRSDYAYVMVGGRGAGCAAPERLAYDVAASLVGETQDSVVQGLVRRERGLAYEGFAWHVALCDTGIFRVGVGTAPERASEVAHLLTSEIEALASAPPAVLAGRVARAARQERHRYAFEHESSVDLALGTGRNLLVGKAPHWSVATGPFAAADPTPGDVQAALSRLVEDGLTVVSTAGEQAGLP